MARARKTTFVRRVCFVTGTRAEYGLMRSTLDALQADPQIELQIVATGMHTHRSRGRTVDEIRRDGRIVHATIAWREDTSANAIARSTGIVSAKLAQAFDRLNPDVVLVVGDRVEAFAAASAAVIGGRVLAHVHGGDRALGQADDSLRHAISKLAHLHFAATKASGERLFAMGEDRRRIHVVGAPGVDGIRAEALDRTSLAALGIDHAPGRFILLLLHPTDARETDEAKRTAIALKGVRQAWEGPIIALLPNSDAGADGIVGALMLEAAAGRIELFRHVGRNAFLGLLRDAAALIGNSSAGIIEAGSFGTRVVDIGPRQKGREHGPNVAHVPFDADAIAQAVSRAVRAPRTPRSAHPYDRGGAAERITRVLRDTPLDERLRRKLIRY